MAITLIANTGAGSGDNNNVTTSAIDTTGATLLVVIVGSYGASGGAAPTDSKGNTWTALTARGAGADAQTRMYYAAAPTVGSGHTFSVLTATKYPSICVLAFAGAATVSPFDAENGATSNAASAIATGSVTPSAAGEVVVAGYVGYSGNVSSIDGSFTISDTVAYAAAHLATGAAYLIQTSAVAANPTWTLGGPNTNTAAVACLKAAAGGGGGSATGAAQHYYRQMRGR